MPRQFQSRVFSFFGSETDDVGTKVEEGKSLVAQNFYRRRNKFVSRLGTLGLYQFSSPSTIDGLQWSKINGTENLICLQNGNVLDAFGSLSNPLSGGTSRFTGGDDSNMAWVEQNLIAGTGKAQNVRYNGAVVTQCLPDQPPVSGVTLTAVSSGVALSAGAYSYRFAFVSADGKYSFPSDITSPTSGITVTGGILLLSGIPVCLPGQDTVGTAVFRTTALGGDYYLAATLPAGTTSYYDATADINLDTLALQFYNTRFPPCRKLVEWQNRMIGADCQTSEGNQRTVYVSNILEYMYCPTAPNIDDNSQGTPLPLQDIAGGVITALHPHGSVLLVFTGGAAYLLSGTDPQSFFLTHLTNHGCTAHRTVASVRNMVIWLSWDGVYLWDGTQVLRISDDQYNTLLGESSTNDSLASAFFWDEKYFLCFPDRTLVFDLLYQQWSVNTNWIWRNTTVTVYTSDKKPRIYAAPITGSLIWQCETGNTDNGGPIPLQWDSGDENLGMSYRTKRVDYIGCEFKLGTGTATINLYKTAGELIQTETFDLSVPKGPNSSIARFLARAVEQARDEFFRLEVIIPATAFTEYLLAEMHFTIAD